MGLRRPGRPCADRPRAAQLSRPPICPPSERASPTTCSLPHRRVWNDEGCVLRVTADVGDDERADRYDMEAALAQVAQRALDQAGGEPVSLVALIDLRVHERDGAGFDAVADLADHLAVEEQLVA